MKKDDNNSYPVRVMNNLQGEGKGDCVYCTVECRGEEREEREKEQEG